LRRDSKNNHGWSRLKNSPSEVSSVVTEASSSASKQQEDSLQSGTAKLNSIHLPYLKKGGQESRTSATSHKSTGRSSRSPTSSAEASPAKTSASQESKGASSRARRGVVYGEIFTRRLGYYDRDTSSLRTYQRLLFSDSTSSLQTLPRRGMMQSGLIFGHPTSAHPTKENESLSSPIPTPTTDSVNQRKKEYAQGGMPLAMYAQKFPTPRTSDVEGGIVKDVQLKNGNFFRKNKEGVRWGVKLRDAVAMFPTPAKRDYKDNASPSEHNRHSPSMASIVGGKLNPHFVEWLMNLPNDWTKITSERAKTIYNQENPINQDGNDTKERPNKTLRGLQGTTHKEAYQRAIGRQRGILEKKILQPKMHGDRANKRDSDKVDVSQESKEVQEEELRTMRNNRESWSASQRQQLEEQLTREPTNIMLILSHKTPLEEWEESIQKTISVQDLWTACEEIGHVPEALSEIQEIWRCLSDEEKEWVALRIGTRNPWCAERPMNTRVVNGIAKGLDNYLWKERIKALGNGVVPQVATWVGERILISERNKYHRTLEIERTHQCMRKKRGTCAPDRLM